MRIKRFLVIALVLGVVLAQAAVATGAKEGAAAGGAKKLSVGVIMWGLKNEGTWDPYAYEMMTALSQKYPIQVEYSEEVDMNKIEAAVRSLAAMHDIVWAHSQSYEGAVKKIAPSFPKTIFIVEWAIDQGKDFYPPNVVTIGQNPDEALFLAGALSAKMSKTKKIGFIQAINQPSETEYAVAYRDGALYADPKINVLRMVIDAYTDPVKTRDSVKAFKEQGADVVFISTEDFAGTLEAKALGIYSAHHYRDMTKMAPDTILNNALWKWDSIMEKIIKAALENRFTEFRSQNWFIPLSLKNDTLGLGTYGNMVPDSVKTYIKGLEDSIKSGKIVVEQKFEW